MSASSDSQTPSTPTPASRGGRPDRGGGDGGDDNAPSQTPAPAYAPGKGKSRCAPRTRRQLSFHRPSASSASSPSSAVSTSLLQELRDLRIALLIQDVRSMSSEATGAAHARLPLPNASDPSAFIFHYHLSPVFVRQVIDFDVAILVKYQDRRCTWADMVHDQAGRPVALSLHPASPDGPTVGVMLTQLGAPRIDVSAKAVPDWPQLSTTLRGVYPRLVRRERVAVLNTAIKPFITTTVGWLVMDVPPAAALTSADAIAARVCDPHDPAIQGQPSPTIFSPPSDQSSHVATPSLLLSPTPQPAQPETASTFEFHSSVHIDEQFTFAMPVPLPRPTLPQHQQHAPLPVPAPAPASVTTISPRSARFADSLLTFSDDDDDVNEGGTGEGASVQVVAGSAEAQAAVVAGDAHASPSTGAEAPVLPGARVEEGQAAAASVSVESAASEFAGVQAAVAVVAGHARASPPTGADAPVLPGARVEEGQAAAASVSVEGAASDFARFEATSEFVGVEAATSEVVELEDVSDQDQAVEELAAGLRQVSVDEVKRPKGPVRRHTDPVRVKVEAMGMGMGQGEQGHVLRMTASSPGPGPSVV